MFGIGKEVGADVVPLAFVFVAIQRPLVSFFVWCCRQSKKERVHQLLHCGASRSQPGKCSYAIIGTTFGCCLFCFLSAVRIRLAASRQINHDLELSYTSCPILNITSEYKRGRDDGVDGVTARLLLHKSTILRLKHMTSPSTNNVVSSK